MRSAAGLIRRRRWSGSKASTGASMEEMTQRNNAVASSSPRRWLCSRSANSLISSASSPSASSCRAAARAKGVIGLAQRRDHVGQGLQRADDLLHQQARRNQGKKSGATQKSPAIA